MTRRLTVEQQVYVAEAAALIDVVIAAYLKRNHDLIEISQRCDLHGAAQQAACLAALTYDPAKAGISAYFSVAMHRAIAKEIMARKRHERRMRAAWQAKAEKQNPYSDRMRGRAMKALGMLSPYDRRLLEDYLIEGVTLDRLGREQGLHKHTIRKRISIAVDRLRDAERDLP